MAYMTLDGFVVPVASFSESDDSLSETGRTVTGAYFRDRRVRKQSWSVETPLVTYDEALAIAGLVNGAGHHWSFDSDVYSSKGLGDWGGTLTIGQISPSPKYGTGRVEVTSDADIIVGTFPDWTLSVWIFRSGWERLTLRSDTSDEWIDGVRQSGSSQPARYTSNQIELDATEDYDDLVFTPYVMPDDWIESEWDTSQAFSDLPQLRLSGDCVSGATFTVQGADDVSFTATNTGGQAFSSDRYIAVSFTLREV